MRARLERFMYGRYGNDDLNRFMFITALVLCMISMFGRWTLLYSIGLVVLVFTIIRMLSRNVEKRRDENLAFLRLRSKPIRFAGKIRSRVSQSKTHRFYRCPSCRQSLRVPKGKGRIIISCPKCRASFEKRT